MEGRSLGELHLRGPPCGPGRVFGSDVNTQQLQDHLCEHFAEQAVPIQSVIDHVVVATPFHSSHVKTKTLMPLQKAGRISSPNQQKANTYPDGTVVQFP